MHQPAALSHQPLKKRPRRNDRRNARSSAPQPFVKVAESLQESRASLLLDVRVSVPPFPIARARAAESRPQTSAPRSTQATRAPLLIPVRVSVPPPPSHVSPLSNRARKYLLYAMLVSFSSARRAPSRSSTERCTASSSCSSAATARSRHSQHTSAASTFPHRLTSGRAALTCTSRYPTSSECQHCATACAGACERSTALGPAPQEGPGRSEHCRLECAVSRQCDCVRRARRGRTCNSLASQASAKQTTSRRRAREHRVEQQRSHNPSRLLICGRVARSRSPKEFWAAAHSHIAREFVRCTRAARHVILFRNRASAPVQVASNRVHQHVYPRAAWTNSNNYAHRVAQRAELCTTGA